MGKLVVYLIRHGRKDLERFRKSSGEPCYLSKEGLKQAEYLAKKFSKMKINQIISSDFERAIQTAKPTSRLIGIPLDIDPGFGEISKEFRSTFRHKKGYNKKEVREDIARIKKSWNKVIKKSGKIIIFAHGGTNRMIMSLVLGVEPYKVRFGLNPAGITEIRINEKGEKGIRHSNDTSHLPESLRSTQSE